jgi:hypothetical protein
MMRNGPPPPGARESDRVIAPGSVAGSGEVRRLSRTPRWRRWRTIACRSAGRDPGGPMVATTHGRARHRRRGSVTAHHGLRVHVLTGIGAYRSSPSPDLALMMGVGSTGSTSISGRYASSPSSVLPTAAPAGQAATTSSASSARRSGRSAPGGGGNFIPRRLPLHDADE